MQTLSKDYFIQLPNQEPTLVNGSMNYQDFLEKEHSSLSKKALGVKVNGKILDLSQPIESSGKLEILSFDNQDGKEIFWHSSAHVLAQAVKRHFPDVQLTVGPVIQNGPGFFYYDIKTNQTITEDDFQKIEDEMHKIRDEAHKVTRHVYERSKAIQEFNEMGENFKADIITSIPGDEALTVYRQGEFQDLCRGPHVPNTSKLGFFKLTTISGAYWKGDPSSPMLQRLYGVSFPSEKELKIYLKNIEEAKKRDHRKLGKELELFSLEEFAPGMIFYHAKGTVLFNILSEYIRRECKKRGYEEIKTPTIMSADLWVRSGHYENFKENMYFTEIEDKEFAIKPMNCPGANLVYKNKLHSYRSLPLRMAELGTVYRNELSGVLHGLFRVRSFTQDDAHIYCTPEQLQEEVSSAIRFTKDVYHKFGFSDIDVFIATRPEKALGSDEIWDKAIHALTSALDDEKTPYNIKKGEGAFYGPKIEFNIRDCLGRHWQCGTIQLDFFLPERFDLEYIGDDGSRHRPIMIHRAILGSLERFLGILIEHYAGKFPLWLSPTQISLLTVNEAQNKYAQKINDTLEEKGLRVTLDTRNEKIGYKIREWNQKKINYAIILGKNEEESLTISVRKRGDQETISMNINDFLKQISEC